MSMHLHSICLANLRIQYTPIAALVGKIHNKKSCLLKDEFIIDPTTLGGYRSLIKIRRFCRDHMLSSQLPEK